LTDIYWIHININGFKSVFRSLIELYKNTDYSLLYSIMCQIVRTLYNIIIILVIDKTSLRHAYSKHCVYDTLIIFCWVSRHFENLHTSNFFSYSLKCFKVLFEVWYHGYYIITRKIFKSNLFLFTSTFVRSTLDWSIIII